MEEGNPGSPRLSRRDDWYINHFRDDQSRPDSGLDQRPPDSPLAGSFGIGKIFQELYPDSQMSSPDINTKEIDSFLDGFEESDDNQKGNTCCVATCSGVSTTYKEVCDAPLVRPKVVERERKIGYCSGNFLNISEDVNDRYIREYQSNNTGVQEKKLLSPIVEKKMTISRQIGEEVSEPKLEKGRSGSKKKISLGRLSRQGSKEKAAYLERQMSKTNPNIEKMLKDLLIKYQTEESDFHAIDTKEVTRKISNDESGRNWKKFDPSTERPKSSLFPFFTNLCEKDLFKLKRKFQEPGKRTKSEGASSDGLTVGIQIEGEELGYDEVTGFWEDVCFTPRTDRKYIERRKALRRNSSPDVLLSSPDVLLSKQQSCLKEMGDSLKERLRLMMGERQEKSGSGRLSRQESKESPTIERVRKTSRQSTCSRDTPTPERLRKQSKQASRQNSKDTPTPERKRSRSKQCSRQGSRDISTPERKRSQASRQNSRDTPPPERLICHSRQASRQNSRDVATPERKRSRSRGVTSRQNSRDITTPELKKSQAKQSLRQNSCENNTPKGERKEDKRIDRKGKKLELKRTSSTPELYRRASQRQRSKSSSRIGTSSCNRKYSRHAREEEETGRSSRPSSEEYRCSPRSRRFGFGGREGSIDGDQDWQETDHHQSLFMSLMYTIPEGKECPITIIIEDVESMPDEVESTPTSHIDSRKQWRRVLYLVQAIVSLKKSKKSSFSRKKQNSKDADDEVEQLNSGPVDPVYSLLKCAADLPRSGGKSPCLVHPHCSGQHSAAGYSRYPSGGDSSGNTSKTSSPSSSALVIRRDFALALPHQNVTGVSNRSSYNSLDHAHNSPDHTYRPDDHSPSANQPAAVLMDSYNPYNSSKHPSLEGCVPIVIEPPVSREASHSPKTRRKKLNARMKSFSLDTPEPPKQLLGIDETTKKKSSSFTNTCFGGKESPDDKMMAFSAASLRKKFALGRASSLETDDKKNRSYTPSPKESPKSQRKEKSGLYVALYNFKAKEKDDMDLRPGWRVTVTDSSKKDWWKGKSHGKSGYFPSTYIIPLLPDQRVFQVLQPLNLSDGHYAIKFHKDQIVLQVGDEVEGMIQIRAANNRQAMCPLVYLQEL